MERLNELIRRINFDYPGLEKAKAYHEAMEDEKCLDEVIYYYRNRKEPFYLFDIEKMREFHDESILKDAQQVMEHEIYGYRFDGDIDWYFNPTADSSRDNEWSWSLFRHIYWQPLARAYVMTGDEKYAREFIKQMKEFAKAWPAKSFIEDNTFENKFSFPGHAWRTIEAAIRMYTTWLPCFVAFRNSQEWDREGWLVFLTMICDSTDFLMERYSNHNRSSNWLTMESSAVLQCGILFQELKSDWFITGYERVMHELKYSFDNDGIHMERTPIYHMVATITYLQSWMLCKNNNIAVPPYGLPILEKAAEFIMHLVKPDFSTPMIGDADRNDLLARRSDTSIYEGMNLTFDPTDLNEMRAYFRTMYEITGREDFLYFATKREQGKAPKERNFKMIEAGIYVMRSGWEKEDSYFHVHGIQLERGEKSTHSHNDQGHVELHIHGEDVLIDSGRYIYNSSCWKDWRHYFLSACAHNTLYVDDHEMGVVPGISRVRGVRTHCHRFEENEQYRVIDLSHNGYVYTEDPIYHRRKVVNLLADVFIIDDEVTGLGLKEHDLRLYFNFAPGNLEKTGNQSFAYTTEKGTEFMMECFSDKEVAPKLLKGSIEPIGGWVSYGYPIREAIPQLHLATKGPVLVRFVTVVAPKGVTATAVISMEKATICIERDGRNTVVSFHGEAISIE